MSRPQTYRDVEIPDTWNEWPRDAKVNYLCTVMDRDQLLRSISDVADIPGEEIGEQSIHKTGLAQLIVELQGDGGNDE
jgi:hypothetical protein